jgi:hypothetical protein
MASNNTITAICAPQASTFVVPMTLPLLLALLFFALRMYARLWPRINLQWDDYTICIAVFFKLLHYTCAMVYLGLTSNRFCSPVPKDRIILAAKFEFAASILWPWCETFIKVSVSFMMMRLLSSPPWHRGLSVFIVMMFLSGIIQNILLLVECHPIRANWNPHNRRVNDECWSPQRVKVTIIITSSESKSGIALEDNSLTEAQASLRPLI